MQTCRPQFTGDLCKTFFLLFTRYKSSVCLFCNFCCLQKMAHTHKNCNKNKKCYFFQKLMDLCRRLENNIIEKCVFVCMLVG